jgi:ABC-type sugar transport system substrate-binding protein
MKKRAFIHLILVALAAAMFLREDGLAAALSKTSGKKVIAGVFIRSLSNPYEIQLSEGARKFADFHNARGANIVIQILPCEGSDEKQINDLKALLVQKDDDTDVIVFIIVNQDPLLAEVAELCEEAEVYWASCWNIPEGMHPKDYNYWAAHSGLDDFVTGQKTAAELFDSLDTPNQGRILALKGMLAVTSSIKRYEGLEDILTKTPGVKLLDVQAADWLASKAMTITETWLSKYPDVSAIWCANDDMAIGVVQALKAKRLNGKVKVCGADGIPDAVLALEAGDMVCTMNNNPYVQSGYMLSYAYNALIGRIDPATMKPEEKYFNTPGSFWTRENIAIEKGNVPALDYDDLKYAVESAK